MTSKPSSTPQPSALQPGLDGLDSMSPRREIEAQIARLQKEPQSKAIRMEIERLTGLLDVASETGGFQRVKTAP